ncbi:MAG: GNAT family N-acetyltransferase [Candidatus Marinimicrobia bacterium]|nr:GNAT family N-acetyltransferase [Candidatus Neomarinimicrobiota bacterium]
MHDKKTYPSDIQSDLEKFNVTVIRGNERADFLTKADGVSIPSWPEFMMHDQVANKYWNHLNEKFASFQFALSDGKSGKWIAVGNSIPVAWTAAIDDLPDEGWDWALRSGMEDDLSANMLCALAIQILPEFRGSGLSSLMVRIMKHIGSENGYDRLIAPVRPSKKSDYPLLGMEKYLKWTSRDGRFDPWIRVHERLGARVIKICPRAMRIQGRISEWESWTDRSFQSSGQYIIPGALSVINIDVENDCGNYVEPNVWMLHKQDSLKQKK